MLQGLIRGHESLGLTVLDSALRALGDGFNAYHFANHFRHWRHNVVRQKFEEKAKYDTNDVGYISKVLKKVQNGQLRLAGRP